MKFPEFLKSLPDPDYVCSTEYRMVIEMVQDCDDFAMAKAACEELQEQALRMFCAIEDVEE